MRLHRFSLSRRLQSTSLLAVLAGYVLLLAANHGLASLQRRQAHQQLLSELQAQLGRQADDRAGLAAELARLWLPSLQVSLLPPQPPALASPERTSWERALPEPPAAAEADGAADGEAAGERWMVSRLSVPLASGASAQVLVREDVSQSLQREGLAQLLLIAAAGVSSLVTSGLLRPVLRRGLVEPLQQLSRQLDATQAPPSGGNLLAVEAQPEELRPIARSFNQLQERLACSWQRERSFVDGVAHELRTPITLIHGQAQSLLRHRLDPPTRQAVQQIDAEARRMASLVSALLELARQDAGRLQLHTSALDPQEQLLIAYERLQPGSGGRLRLDGMAAGAGSEAAADAENSGPALPPVRADADRLQQCLAALINNALLYSPAPRPVRLAASRQAEGVVLHVIDQGPGVPEAERAQIFERFVRGSASVDVRGSGIGLAMVQQLMAAMGGSVAVVDAPGGGADFQLRLPLAA